MSSPRVRVVAALFAAAVLAGCTAMRATRNAEYAMKKGDYDSAVAYYREALAAAPARIELRIALERATRTAAAEHIKRARELEGQDQLTGAMAEYKLAADLDSTNTLATSKAAELERTVRDRIEASRPPARIDSLRAQAAQSSPIAKLDPRVRVPTFRFTTASVRELLTALSQITGININFDRELLSLPNLSQNYPIDRTDASLEDVLNQIMQGNGLAFKVQSPSTIFVFQDTQQKHNQYDDQYVQQFYLSNATPQNVITVLQATVAQGAVVQPRFTASPDSNSITVRGTAPVLQIVEQIIRANDRPKPEVMVEAEILEVDRTFIRELGVDLSQYALGFTFSPELAPPNTTATTEFPLTPPPFNLNTISQGVSPADFYLTSPTALVRLLESNTKTRVLAQPQLRGRDGQNMSLALGDSIPIPQTTFQSGAAGGFANIPTTSVTYTPVGVNLVFTPRVTYQDEIVLDGLRLEKNGLGNNIDVAGQSFPTIVQRSATGSIRLRDGESTLIAGLLRDDNRSTQKSLPGFSRIPGLRNILGNTATQVDQTDIVMIITPHIVRSHDLTPEDLKPMYIGTGTNLGAGAVPTLISPDAIGVTNGVADAGAVPAPPAGAVQLAAGAPGGAGGAPAGAANAASSAPRAVGIVPIEAVPSPGAAPPAVPAGPARVALTAPTAAAEGALNAGSGPHTIPITITNAPPIVSISLTITADPAIVKVQTVTKGTFMDQGGTTATFVPRVDAGTGRVDIVLSRPAAQPAASSGTVLLGAIAFTAGSTGATDVSVTGVATGVNGQTVPLTFAPIHLVVK